MGDDILVVTFSPDATKLAAVDQNGNSGNSSAFAYCSYSTPLVASSTAGQQLALWDVDTGEPVTIIAEHTHSSDARYLSFSPDSRWLVTASDKVMVMHDAATGGKLTEITVGVSWLLRMVQLWPDSRYLVSGYNKGVLQFWNVESGALVKAFDGHTRRQYIIL